MLQSPDSLESQAPQSVNWLEAGDILLYLPFFGHPHEIKGLFSGVHNHNIHIIYQSSGILSNFQGTFSPWILPKRCLWTPHHWDEAQVAAPFLPSPKHSPSVSTWGWWTLKAGQSQLEWLRRDIVSHYEPLFVRTDLTDWIGSFMEPFQLVVVMKSMEW